MIVLKKPLACFPSHLTCISAALSRRSVIVNRTVVIGFEEVDPDPINEEGKSASEALEEYGCLHFKTPIICGVSEPRHSPEELKRLNERNTRTFNINGKEMTGYEASQAMRRLETEVRKQKDIRTIARESGDKEQVRRCNARIKACKAKYAEISDITGIAQEPKRMSVPRMPKTGGNPLTSAGNGGIIEKSRSISAKNMSNGMRRSVFHELSDPEIQSLKEDIRAIGADESKFVFNSGEATSYSDKHDIVFVKGDVLPDPSSTHPRDLLSSRAALAHEYYGHRTHRGTKLKNGSWNDEFRASYIAAKITPNLSTEERRYLILDALERAKEAGVTIKHNDYIRRMLYE